MTTHLARFSESRKMAAIVPILANRSATTLSSGFLSGLKISINVSALTSSPLYTKARERERTEVQ